MVVSQGETRSDAALYRADITCALGSATMPKYPEGCPSNVIDGSGGKIGAF